MRKCAASYDSGVGTPCSVCDYAFMEYAPRDFEAPVVADLSLIKNDNLIQPTWTLTYSVMDETFPSTTVRVWLVNELTRQEQLAQDWRAHYESPQSVSYQAIAGLDLGLLRYHFRVDAKDGAGNISHTESASFSAV